MCAIAAVALSACATSPAAPPAPPRPPLGQELPAAPDGEVLGQGTVIDVAGQAQLCLGGVMESYPPQCHGVPLEGWTWEGVDGSESSGDVTWGSYAVRGTYDGETFTLTDEPVMLALYDPMPFPDPTGGKPGTGEEGSLVGIQDSLFDRLGPYLLMSSAENGYLWVDVVWDDGTLQHAADAEFGDDVVVIRSALRPVEG